MCPTSFLNNVVAAVVYQVLMFYGIVCLVSYWSFIHIREAHDQDIPDFWFMVFGLVLPAIGWLLSVLWAPGGFVLPASLAILYLRAKVVDGELARLRQELDGEDLAQARRLIAADERNAAGFWALAKLRERQGIFQEALDNYRRAHSLCQRTVTPDEMSEIEIRLADLLETQRLDAGGGRPGTPAAARRWQRRLQAACIGLGTLFIFSNWIYAVNVCVLMLFLRWLHSRGTAAALRLTPERAKSPA